MFFAFTSFLTFDKNFNDSVDTTGFILIYISSVGSSHSELASCTHQGPAIARIFPGDCTIHAHYINTEEVIINNKFNGFASYYFSIFFFLSTPSSFSPPSKLAIVIKNQYIACQSLHQLQYHIAGVPRQSLKYSGSKWLQDRLFNLIFSHKKFLVELSSRLLWCVCGNIKSVDLLTCASLCLILFQTCPPLYEVNLLWTRLETIAPTLVYYIIPGTIMAILFYSIETTFSLVLKYGRFAYSE